LHAQNYSVAKANQGLRHSSLNIKGSAFSSIDGQGSFNVKLNQFGPMVKELNKGDSGVDILNNLGPMSNSAKHNRG